METFRNVQYRLDKGSINHFRKDITIDFPLRGHLLCSKCNSPYTGSWNKGRNDVYANYHCKQKGCINYGKSISRNIIHPQFEELLNQLKPTRHFFEHANAVIDDYFGNIKQYQAKKLSSMECTIHNLDEQISKYSQRIIECSNNLLISQYEKELEKLLKQRDEFKNEIPQQNLTPQELGTKKHQLLEYIKNPFLHWNKQNLEKKKCS